MTGDKWHAEGGAIPPACYEFAQQLAPGVYLIAAVVYTSKTSLYSARVAWYDFRIRTYYRYSIHARKFSTASQAMSWCEMVQSTVQQVTKGSYIASLNATGMG